MKCWSITAPAIKTETSADIRHRVAGADHHPAHHRRPSRGATDHPSAIDQRVQFCLHQRSDIRRLQPGLQSHHRSTPQSLPSAVPRNPPSSPPPAIACAGHRLLQSPARSSDRGFSAHRFAHLRQPSGSPPAWPPADRRASGTGPAAAAAGILPMDKKRPSQRPRRFGHASQCARNHQQHQRNQPHRFKLPISAVSILDP